MKIVVIGGTGLIGSKVVEWVADPTARYFNAQLQERTLVAGDGAHLGAIHFNDWLAQPTVT